MLSFLPLALGKAFPMKCLLTSECEIGYGYLIPLIRRSAVTRGFSICPPTERWHLVNQKLVTN